MVGLVGTPFRLVGNEFGDQRHTAPCDVDSALAAVRCTPGIFAPGQPGTRGLRVDLGVGQALPVSQVRLAQPGVDVDLDAGGQAERDRRFVGPAQVRGDDQQRLAFGQDVGGGDGLCATEVGQVGVELTLHAAARIPFGLPMPQQDQPTDPHGPPSGTTSFASPRSTGITGQSRHNRSSA